MRAGVLVFPGSNCDEDAVHALCVTTGATVDKVWHAEPIRERYDLLVLPGGFSWGDYLRTGAIAARAVAMQGVREHAARGGLVLGICNGFQVLTEAGLLPGVLLVNRSLRFTCRDVHLKVETGTTPFTSAFPRGAVVTMPVAHGMGNYFADDETLDRLEGEARVVLRYCDARGRVSDESNPNGAARNIAGIVNERGNVMGLMPHPERNAEACLGSADGALMFRSVRAWVEGPPRPAPRTSEAREVQP